MKKIFLFVFIATLLSCTGNVKKRTSFISGSIEKAGTKETCDDKLLHLILSCSNFETPFDKEKMHTEIVEEREDGVILIRLFEYGTGVESTSTQGWIELSVKTNSLKDITMDPDSPIILKYDADKFQEYVEGCLGKRVVKKEEKSFDSYYRELPAYHLPLTYSYEFILDLPQTQEVDKDLYPFFVQLQDNETDLNDCRIAKIPSAGEYKIFVLFAHDKKGEGRYILYSLNERNELADKLLIYFSKDVKWKDGVENCYLDYMISKQDEIILKETIALPDGNITVKQSLYHIADGKFIPAKAIK